MLGRIRVSVLQGEVLLQAGSRYLHVLPGEGRRQDAVPTRVDLRRVRVQGPIDVLQVSAAPLLPRLQRSLPHRPRGAMHVRESRPYLLPEMWLLYESRRLEEVGCTGDC